MRIDGPQITGSFNLNGDTVADLDIFTTTSSFNMMTASMATTGSNVFVGTQTSSGSIVPSVNNTYDLGSPTHQFRHVYISSGSLYVNGTKVLGSTAQELQITTDAGQSFKILESSSDTITLQSADGNITLATSGGGDVIMDPTNGVIGLKGTVTIYTGNKITSSDGNSIQFGNGIAVTGSIVSTTTSLVSGSSQISYSGLSGVPSDIISGSGQLTTLGIATTGSNTFNGNLTVTGFIDTQELRTTYISSSILYRSGSTKFGDELTDTHSFTGSILISGSISVPGSNLVSGSSQVLNGSGVFSGSAQLPSGLVSSSAQTIANLPSGVVSGSAQTIANLPSGTVSGSVQVDVMSTTNIARLATTGSNTFTSNQIISGSVSITGSINVTGSLLTTGSSVGIGGQANPVRTLHVMGQGAFDMTHAGVVIQDSISPMTASQIVSYKQTNAVGSAYRNMHLRADVLGVAIMSGSGYVSIGKDSANSMLDVNGNTTVTGSITTTGTINGISIPNDLFAQQFLLMGS